MPKTKIIATLGPASENPNVLRKMMLAGLDVVRLNFSHGTRQDKIDKIKLVRELNRKYRRKLRILGDLEGYRIRIGHLGSPVEIKKNQELFLTQEQGRKRQGYIPFDYSGSLHDIHKGAEIFIDDGNLALRVEGHEDTSLKTRVTVGGLLKEHKGVNIPQARLRFAGLTEKDKENISFCREEKIDFIAQSFVRTGDDMRQVREHLGP
ncbi:MAG: pyruvate kinase, partial [Deltaproteobacteria bacterium]